MHCKYCGSIRACRCPAGVPQAAPLPQDLAYVVFATDPRVIAHARVKFEVPAAETDAKELKAAVLKLWDLGKNKHDPEATWYSEAQAIGERVGKPWHETPQPTLVEALSSALKEPLIPVGFKPQMVPAGATAQLEAEPYVTVRPMRLVVPDRLAEYFVIDDLKVGHMSVWASSAPVPASCFSDKAFPLKLAMDVIHIGQRAKLTVTNTSGNAMTLHATLWCSDEDHLRMVVDPVTQAILQLR